MSTPTIAPTAYGPAQTPPVTQDPTAPGGALDPASLAARAKDPQGLADLLTQLVTTSGAVQRKDWLSGELNGVGTPSIEQLGSTAQPMSGLSSAGLDWLLPMVSFLAEPLEQLRGNPGPVTSGAEGFQTAAQEVADTSEAYRQQTTSETDQWSGDAASGYREQGSQFADGLSALSESSSTVSGAIAGAGEVVGQVVGIVTGLIAEAVGKIVPIMSQAIAEAPATFGASIAAAIPQCVQIAVDYGGQIASKLGALLASGENLMKLVNGALAVVDVVKKVLTAISQQSTDSGTSSAATSSPSTSQPSYSDTSDTSDADDSEDSADSDDADDKDEDCDEDKDRDPDDEEAKQDPPEVRV